MFFFAFVVTIPLLGQLVGAGEKMKKKKLWVRRYQRTKNLPQS